MCNAEKRMLSVKQTRFDRHTLCEGKNVVTTCVINSSSASTTKLAGHDKRYRLSPAFNSRRPTCSIGREFDPLLLLLHRAIRVVTSPGHRSISLRNTPAVLRTKISHCETVRVRVFVFFPFILFSKSLMYFNCCCISTIKTYCKWERIQIIAEPSFPF